MRIQTSALPEIEAEKAERMAEHLTAWFREHKRELPWRGADPYGVWISEIMLQQTTVAAVIPFYRRFMAQFPTLESLADAPLDNVLKYWAGLGYYARARNLHRTAQIVARDYEGKIPDCPETIETLPGIGRYTAGAILSIAYNLPRPLVDANVIRVVSRLFGLTGDPKSAANQAALWHLATKLVEASESPGDFNQGLMELGALICNPSDPRCEQCPLLSDCVAGNSPEPNRLPEFPPGKSLISVSHSAVVIRNREGNYLIVQRPIHGLWGGLWEFPRVVCETAETPEEGAERAAREIVGLAVRVGRRIGKIKHVVTHHKITLSGYAAELEPQTQIPAPVGCAAFRWEPLENLPNYAFSRPQVLLRETIEAALARQSDKGRQHTFDFEEENL